MQANQPDLRTYEVPTDELVPYARNAKLHPDWQVAQIAESIKRFGFNDPVGVWHDAGGRPVIVEGHGRVMAARELGIASVPCVALDHLDDEGRRAYALAHNNLTMNSGWDEDVLASELADLEDMDMGDFGFEDMAPDAPVEAVEVDVPEDAEPRCQRGDVWRLGRHRLMCGDSSDPDEVHILVAGGGAPMMVFTDPPYGVAIGDKNKALDTFSKAGRITENILGDTLSTDELYDLLVRCFTNLREVCDESCSYYVSSPQGGELGLMMMMMMDAGLPVRHNLIWKKNAPTFSMGRLDYDYKHEPIFYTWTKRHVFHGGPDNTVLEFDKPMSSRLHPTMKPVALVAHLMENSSKEGDVVMDIFGGSGTTLIAAEQLGRTCYMMELDPHYCDVIIERWEQMTGGTAEKVA